MAPTFSRSSLAGVGAGIAGFGSFSGRIGGGGPARRSVGASPASCARLENGRCGRRLRWNELGRGGIGVRQGGLVVACRFKALSIADIAAETGSVAGFCFTIASASLVGADRRNDRHTRQAFPRARRGRTKRLRINHVAVYRRASKMKTTPAAQLANVVNASVTMFFHSVQRSTAAFLDGGVQGDGPERYG